MKKLPAIENGTRFGRLVVTAGPFPLKVHNKGGISYECACDCGNNVVCAGYDLRSEHTRSCGCFLRESRKVARKTHGLTRTPTYRSWYAMKNRCLKPKERAYDRYGGKGITVCERWLTFSNFLDDMGERPDGTTLDRIDSNGNYEPENCRWSTVAVQARNRSITRFYTHNGKTQCLTDWAAEAGMSLNMLRRRIAKGYSIGEAIATPKMKPGRQTQAISAGTFYMNEDGTAWEKVVPVRIKRMAA